MNSSSSSSTRSTTITSAFSGDLSLRRRVTARKNNNNFNDASSLLSSSGGIGIGIGDDNDTDDTTLVESIVQRMLNDRPSLGLVQKETKSKIQDAMNKRVLSSSSSSSSSNIVNNNIPLNSNTNKRGRYKHKHYYATSPIVQYMNERCYYNNGGGGTIYVAYVGEGLGKTTACYAFSKMNPKNTIVALTSSSSSSSSSATTKIMDPSSSSSSSSSIFLPHNSRRSSSSSTGTAATMCCLERMISLFKLRWGNVPQGFVTTLIQSLHNNNDKKKNTWIGRILPLPLPGRRSKQGSSIINNHNNHDNRKLQQQQQQRRHNNNTNKNKTIITKKKNTKCSYLIIDDFMSNGSTNSPSDIKFVRQLQKLITNTYSNVCVFLLTPNKESANYLLSLNNDNPNNTNNNNNIVDDIDNHYNIDDRRINNNMNNLAIQPLGNISVMDTIRLPSGRRRIENKRTIGIDISDDVDNDDDNSDKGTMSFDWDRLCSMEWTIQQIQDAIILSENENMNNDSDDYDNDNNNDDNKRQDSLREEIAELLTYMPDEERKTINPLKVKRLLARSVNYHPPIISTTKSKSLIVRNGSDTGFNHGTSSIFENDYSSFQQQHKSPSSTTAATKNNNNNHHPQFISDAYSEMV